MWWPKPIVHVLVWFPVAVIKEHEQKKLGEEEISFSLQVPVHRGKPEQELKEGPWRYWHRDSRQDAYGLVTQGLFSYISSAARAHLPQEGTNRSVLGPPNQVAVKNMPACMPRGQPEWDSSLSSLFPGVLTTEANYDSI